MKALKKGNTDANPFPDSLLRISMTERKQNSATSRTGMKTSKHFMIAHLSCTPILYIRELIISHPTVRHEETFLNCFDIFSCIVPICHVPRLSTQKIRQFPTHTGLRLRMLLYLRLLQLLQLQYL